MAEQVILDIGSHLFAAVSGWAYPMTRAELLATASFALEINTNRAKGSPPFVPDWPWPPEEPAAEKVTPEERAELTANLNANSAFGHIRT